MTVRQPLWLRKEDIPELPDGWQALTTVEATDQLKPGKLYDQKTSSPEGEVPVVNQSLDGFVGYHSNEPGVLASVSNPIVTFANHTCEIRLMKQPFSCIQNIFPKVGREGVCDTRYFYYATKGRVDLSDYKGHHPLFRQAYIPVPPLPTQQRIAAILSAYDNLIENNTRRIAILEEMARRLYEEWFVHFRFPGHDDVDFGGELPRGWYEVPLGEVANVTWGDTKTTKKSYVDTGYVAFSAAGPDGFLPHFDYDRTGVVLSAIGAKCGLTWFARGKWSCIKNTIRLFSKDQTVSDEYLFFTTGFSDYWPKRGAAQPFISQGDAKQCKVVVPPEALHGRFLSVARPALKQADQLQLINANLRAQRDMLLPKLVSGEINVSQAEATLEAAE